jgi:hypothetical protein
MKGEELKAGELAERSHPPQTLLDRTNRREKAENTAISVLSGPSDRSDNLVLERPGVMLGTPVSCNGM